MSQSKLQTFIYCAECEHIVKETLDIINWFEFNFCAVKCLNKFQRKNATKCIECETELTSKKLFVHKSPSNRIGSVGIISSQSILDSFYFCSSDCLDGFKVRTKLCTFCFKILSKNKTFCSDRCRHLMQACVAKNFHISEKCSQCRTIKDIVARIMIDDEKHALCSNNCFNDFVKTNDIALGWLTRCILLDLDIYQNFSFRNLFQMPSVF